MKRLTIVCTPTGTRALYDDRLMELVRPAAPRVERLSAIEFENGRWTVRDARGVLRYEHIDRKVCLDWENLHAAELLRGHPCTPIPTTKSSDTSAPARPS